MLHERLTTDPSAWGLTPTQYASREKARLREREKKRRQRAQAAAKALVVIEESQEWPVATLMTPSGYLAYQVCGMGQVVTLRLLSIQM